MMVEKREILQQIRRWSYHTTPNGGNVRWEDKLELCQQLDDEVSKRNKERFLYRKQLQEEV